MLEMERRRRGHQWKEGDHPHGKKGRERKAKIAPSFVGGFLSSLVTLLLPPFCSG